MKHFLELIPLSAKAHRRQHRMTLFCIALAVFLVTSIFSMADMELRSQKIKALQDYGNWHIMLKHIDEESAGRIALRPDVAASSWYNVLNYRLNDAYAVNGHRAVVCGIEEGFLSDIMQIALAEGSFPAEEGQAILTQNAKDSLGVALGDTVALHTPSGAVCNLTISGFGADTILSAKTDAVCILLPTDAFRTLYSAAAQNELSDSDLVYYVQFKEQVNIPACIRELKEQYGLADDDIAQNAALLGVMGFGRDSYMLGLYGAAAILFVFVLTAGVLMIASSINSSIAQRTAFFGMLRCIGADHALRPPGSPVLVQNRYPCRRIGRRNFHLVSVRCAPAAERQIFCRPSALWHQHCRHRHGHSGRAAYGDDRRPGSGEKSCFCTAADRCFRKRLYPRARTACGKYQPH